MLTKVHKIKVYSAAFIAGFLIAGAAATSEMSTEMAAPIGVLLSAVFAAPSISGMINRGRG